MVCREVEKNDLVAKYVSGQLDPTAQDDFELHILDCESCRASAMCATTAGGLRDSRLSRQPGGWRGNGCDRSADEGRYRDR